MLQLKHIRKSYTTGDFTQQALDDVSISFRNNEFVAILGPSGSGKTTLLNIIGGLDHYDSGDLVIEGVSTKEYKDRDWDTYRNNRVGFVFQSYNLIPHQTVLANVELALTLSGVPKEERRRRALEALQKVGLGEHVNKKPAQMSGGQMQRVAIARALVNDPDIVLADEPTGALDSHTSVQIMDLLTEIARDRLVVMVTHNPELAETYATRIVNLADGEIRSDSDPFDPTEEQVEDAHFPPIRRTKMGFLTALSLSFNNLMTKKGRTIMTAFAGSIGIIGIASILALANGVNSYIESVEEETLSVYPLQIMDTGFDMTTMMSQMAGMGASGDEGDGSDGDGASDGSASAAPEGDLRETKMVTSMFASVENNDLASLKEYLDENADTVGKYAKAVEYGYDVVPQIFDADTEDGVRQINPDTTFNSMGLGTMGSGNAALMSTSTDIFGDMMGDSSIYEDQYEVVAGHLPEKYNECVLITGPSGTIPDLVLYALGLRDRDEITTMVKQFVDGEEVEVPEDRLNVSYEDIMGVKMKVVNAAEFYQYDDSYGVWVDKTDDEEYMKDLVDRSEDLVISGVIRAREDARALALGSMGIGYTPDLVYHLIDQAGGTEVVQQQMDAPSTDVFTGKLFSEEAEGDNADFDMDNLFTVDEGILQSAFSIDESKLQIDPSTLQLNLSQDSLPAPPTPDADAFAVEQGVTLNQEALGTVVNEVMKDFQTHSGDVMKALAAQGVTPADPDYANKMVNAYMALPSTQELAGHLMPTLLDTSGMQAELAAKVQSYLQTAMGSYVAEITKALSKEMEAAMTKAMAQVGANMATAMNVDTDAFARAFQFNMDENQLTELIMSMMSNAQEHTFANNLAKLGYAQLEKPNSIDIYPIDFEGKQEIITLLDAYNDEAAASGDEGREITYTDIVGTLMKSVTTIIDMISYVLIAFVAISLVVSSIMIGVITYISVLERKKEIGILRAIGASKGDISRVFNAETIIEGLVAGLLGVGITALCCIPASAIVYALFDVPNVASLPWGAAAILVVISVVLTFVAGLIPARSASRKDPVEALRSE